jgi:hypothetical protein
MSYRYRTGIVGFRPPDGRNGLRGPSLALSLARDLTGQNGPGPDADLIAACEAFQATQAEMKEPQRA